MMKLLTALRPPQAQRLYGLKIHDLDEYEQLKCDILMHPPAANCKNPKPQMH